MTPFWFFIFGVSFKTWEYTSVSSMSKINLIFSGGEIFSRIFLKFSFEYLTFSFFGSFWDSFLAKNFSKFSKVENPFSQISFITNSISSK